MLVLPIPTPSIFIISSPILTRSPPTNDVIPVNVSMSSVVNARLARLVVTEVATTGDWIILSRAIIAFAFWLIAANLADVPTPTVVIPRVTGTCASAFSAVVHNLTVSSLTLNMKTSPGNLSVVPIPTNSSVVSIPMAWVVPAPAWIYFTFSPVTKKWFGNLIVFWVALIIFVSLLVKSLLNISFPLWVKLKDLLIVFSVPVYMLLNVSTDPFANSTISFSSSSIWKAFMNTFTWVVILGFGVNINSEYLLPALVLTCAPNVPNPATVATLPYSTR